VEVAPQLGGCSRPADLPCMGAAQPVS
jgi:hypothetical protein